MKCSYASSPVVRHFRAAILVLVVAMLAFQQVSTRLAPRSALRRRIAATDACCHVMEIKHVLLNATSLVYCHAPMVHARIYVSWCATPASGLTLRIPLQPIQLVQ